MSPSFFIAFSHYRHYNLDICIICIIMNNTKMHINIKNMVSNMIIKINDMSDIPIYQQIRNQIIAGISEGKLEPGEQLPTVRGLATEIGINSMTVSKAYQQLKQEGYVYSDRRNGVCVCRNFEQKKQLSKASSDELKCIIAEAKVGGMSKEDFLGICEKMFEEGQL